MRLSAIEIGTNLTKFIVVEVTDGNRFYVIEKTSIVNRLSRSMYNDNNDLVARYGKNILVVETGYPYTTDDGDDTPNVSKKECCSLLPEYPATIQGQASYLQTVIALLKDLPDKRGTGCFYWEPAFIPVKGAGWKYGEGSEW